MTKRRDLVAAIRAAATARGIEVLEESGRGPHDKLTVGRVKVTIPRQREVNKFTADGIRKALQPALGERWWQQ